MQAVVQWDKQDNTLSLKGVLDHATVVQVYAEGEAWLNTAPKPAVIDLSQVQQSNSAGLALLLQWLRVAQKNQIALTFKAVPLQMTRLMTVHGLQDLFSAYQTP